MLLDVKRTTCFPLFVFRLSHTRGLYESFVLYAKYFTSHISRLKRETVANSPFFRDFGVRKFHLLILRRFTVRKCIEIFLEFSRVKNKKSTNVGHRKNGPGTCSMETRKRCSPREIVRERTIRTRESLLRQCLEHPGSREKKWTRKQNLRL